MSADLSRFVSAQENCIERVLTELQAGYKSTHWMWYIFPQIEGLGHSSMARRYAIRDLAEARDYLSHPALGPRLERCATLLLAVQGRTATEIMGPPDDLKLRSCATLFQQASERSDSVFTQLLDKYFGGQPDPATLRLLGL